MGFLHQLRKINNVAICVRVLEQYSTDILVGEVKRFSVTNYHLQSISIRT